jgi:hypothetical protein
MRIFLNDLTFKRRINMFEFIYGGGQLGGGHGGGQLGGGGGGHLNLINISKFLFIHYY